MASFHLREADPGPDWVYERLHDLEVVISQEVHGEDQAVSADWNRVAQADERNALKALLLAVPGPPPADAAPGRFGLPEVAAEPLELLGAAQFTMPTADNRHLVDDLYLQVRADRRRQGIGSALWQEVARIGREQGRSTVLGWTEHLIGAAPDAERLPSPAGAGYLPLDGPARFAQSLGLGLAQVERQSRLTLPVPPRQLADLRAKAEAAALPHYRVESWVGRVPDEHLERLAALYRDLSTDAPLGEIDFRPENWDPDRVRHSDEQKHRTGRSVFTLAIQAATGEAAGLTELHIHDAHPHRPEQWTTVVSRAHRGHRLGLLIKAANLELLALVEPGARYVDTWNAGENEHMLAINTALGFRPHAVNGAWQARL